MQQRDIYRIVDRLASGTFENELDLLKTQAREVVEHSAIIITGARIWELHPTEDAYVLRYQYGMIERIPEDYTVWIDDQPSFAQLTKKRTIVNYETDNVLIEKGIKLYSATGVGDLIKRPGGKFYKYALAFNAPEINQTFFDTINIISSAVTLRLKEFSGQTIQRRIQKDLHQAWEIQRSLLPEHEYVFHDFHIFGVSIPDSTVGGDYFDYLQAGGESEERLGIVVSDAASKGLPAAIQALFVSGAVRMALGFHTKISSLISRLNTVLYNTFPYERFVTLFYCELTTSQNGLVLFANAGHCAPLHYKASREEFEILGPTGGLLGIVEEQKFRVENINMRRGDILVIVTDGILEAQNSAGEIFGEERLKELVERYHDQSAQDIACTIIEDVQKFSIGATYTDDKTIVVIKREKKS
jgi:sigma-B regulation protein RsbU (phosphoserine phosphatase)